MKFVLVFVAAAASVAAPVPADAQQANEDIAVSATIRARVETIDGQVRPGLADAETVVTFRTILTAEYGPGPVTFGGEIYDSRAYSIAPRSAVGINEVNALELVQAYIKADLGTVFGGGTATRLQAGRMTLNLASRRLIAADDYRNTTNGSTGLRADVSGPDGFAATLIYVLPQMRLPDGPADIRANSVAIDRESFDLRLWGGTLAKTKAIGPVNVDIGYFRLDERDRPGEPTRDRRLDTISARAIRNPAPGQLDYEIEAIRQTGRVSASAAPGAATLQVSAWFVHAEIGYRFMHPWKPRIAIEYDHASGDEPGGKFERFDTLFGMRRADLAPSGLYNAVGRANISTPGIRIDVAPDDRFDAFITVRDLRLASRTDSFSTSSVRDPSGAAGNNAGRQIDARIRWWAIPKRLQLEIDGLLLDKGRFLTDAPNAPPNGNTRYLSLNATTFF